jgi:hypothetical protein
MHIYADNEHIWKMHPNQTYSVNGSKVFDQTDMYSLHDLSLGLKPTNRCEVAYLFVPG